MPSTIPIRRDIRLAILESNVARREQVQSHLVVGSECGSPLKTIDPGSEAIGPTGGAAWEAIGQRMWFLVTNEGEGHLFAGAEKALAHAKRVGEKVVARLPGTRKLSVAAFSAQPEVARFSRQSKVTRCNPAP